MNIIYRKMYSPSLGKDMEYKVYGSQGKPMLVFPTSNGRFYQYEDFGMIEVLASFIESGQLQVWACDGLDWETFLAQSKHPNDRIYRYNEYDQYIENELVPSILTESRQNKNGSEQKLIVSGCSMGAFHSANFFFRHPENVDVLIALSGIYSTRYFLGDYMDEQTYFHSPLDYLRNLQDEYYLKKFRQSKIIVCVGQGAYEGPMIEDTRCLQQILNDINVPAIVDFWGRDVNHDWNWWKKQIKYYLQRIFG